MKVYQTPTRITLYNVVVFRPANIQQCYISEMRSKSVTSENKQPKNLNLGRIYQVNYA